MLKTIAGNLLLLFVFIEIASASLLRDRVRQYYPSYLRMSPLPSFGSSHPRGHFKADESKGFDIKQNSPRYTTDVVKEISPYPIFGNSLGCFDDESQHSKKKYYVYLAGDSFTWGFSPIENKFGTLLEKELSLPVASCGVPHTGQIHQFAKFKEIVSKLGYYPKYVLVNVYRNDIANDFSHPHTTVIDGYRVDSVTLSNVNARWERQEVPMSELLERYKSWKAITNGSRLNIFDPRSYSATAVLMVELLIKLHLLVKREKPTKSAVKNITIYEMPYLVGNKNYPIDQPVAEKSRIAIKEWIRDSRINGYYLLFLDLRTQPLYESAPMGSQSVDQTFCEYIQGLDTKCLSFPLYLSRMFPEKRWSDLHWKSDPHFNIDGNRMYASFLLSILRK